MENGESIPSSQCALRPRRPVAGPLLAAAGCAFLLQGLLLSGCASQIREQRAREGQAARAEVEKPSLYSGPKRRIAIIKFEDKTGYGSNIFGTIDDLGKQAQDILNAHLIKTGEFILVERENLAALDAENKLQGKDSAAFGRIGASALVFGAVTEFGTKTEAEDAGLSKSKVQTAHAKVAIRLVDPATGVAFYSEFGEARAEKSVNQVLGFGSSAGYDATLTDKALNGAIAKLVGNVLTSLRAQPWSAGILDVSPEAVVISAGARTGIKVGQTLTVIRPGKTVKNPQTGGLIELPGKAVGKLKVVSQFGKGDLDEGSVCAAVEGSGFTTADRVQLDGDPALSEGKQ